MRNCVKVKLRMDELPWRGSLKAVEEGSCRAFFKAGFLKKEENIYAFYNVEGYRKLSDFNNQDSISTLRMAQAFLKSIEICKNKLFLPDQFILNPQTMYFCQACDIAKFVYMPCKTKSSEVNAICTALNCIGQSGDPAGKKYIDSIIFLIKKQNLKTENVTAVIDEMIAEALAYSRI